MTELSTAPRPARDALVQDPRDPYLRLDGLLDPGTLALLHESDDVSAVAVRGQIGGADVVAFCTDGTKKGGAIGAAECRRIADATDLAVRESRPVIGLWHSGGARLADGVEAM